MTVEFYVSILEFDSIRENTNICVDINTYTFA
jgi:hypothetical protein